MPQKSTWHLARSHHLQGIQRRHRMYWMRLRMMAAKKCSNSLMAPLDRRKAQIIVVIDTRSTECSGTSESSSIQRLIRILGVFKIKSIRFRDRGRTWATWPHLSRSPLKKTKSTTDPTKLTKVTAVVIHKAIGNRCHYSLFTSSYKRRSRVSLHNPC